jgi:hypothetical protein
LLKDQEREVAAKAEYRALNPEPSLAMLEHRGQEREVAVADEEVNPLDHRQHLGRQQPSI